MYACSEEKAQDAIFYSYTRYINGFAATLEEEDAMQISSNLFNSSSSSSSFVFFLHWIIYVFLYTALACAFCWVWDSVLMGSY